jgi:hypothetical protein
VDPKGQRTASQAHDRFGDSVEPNHSEPRPKNPSEAKSGNLLIFLMTDGFKWLIDTQERTEEAPGGWQESVPIAAAQLYTPR